MAPETDAVDLPKLVCVVAAPYSLLTALMHPLNVMKVRAQASSSEGLTTMQQLRAMIGKSGVRGLFAGLGPVLAGAVPARASYIAALEGTRPLAESCAASLGASAASASALGNGSAGLAAALVSMMIYVPVDVISQKMMVHGSPGFLEVVRATTAGPNGWTGLYRGLGISLVIGLPAGSIWWATYGAARTSLSTAPSAESAALSEFGQKALASTAAATATVAAVAPLDTIKTHYQLAATANGSVATLAVRLVRRDGLLSLYAGSAPRLLHLAVWSTMLITIYEEMKVWCRRPPSSASSRVAATTI